jgi:cellulose synthase/poly-beta-1,6-N-acetylglucosamine synthase-like glycosyltransferase
VRTPPAPSRTVGIAVLGASALTSALVCLAALALHPKPLESPDESVLFGFWRVLYNIQAPSLLTVVLAAGVAIVIAAIVALLERRISDRYRRSADGLATPLAPKIVMAQTAGVFAGPVTITVLIPAHNEEQSLEQTITSLLGQSQRPDRVVVVADNCTDSTVQVARRCGVEVIETLHNTHKKAGALNQALSRVLPTQGDNDLVMVMDADTVLDAGFLEAAARRFTDDRALMAVGGLFYGVQGEGLVGQFQRNEYVRYARDIRRRRGRVFVLTGTASLFRPHALRTVAERRGTSVPGERGHVYDTAALTEDNELTIAIKSLGGLMISPAECTVVTELMPTWRALWAQRLRWQRGALENLGAYGVTPQTFRYWAQQLGIGYGVVALAAYLVLCAVTALAVGGWIWFPFWLGLGALFMVERVVTAWQGGWRARLLAMTLFPELFYAAFLCVVFVKGALDISLGRQARWKHVTRLGDHSSVLVD